MGAEGEAYLHGDVRAAWERCLPVWKPLGRVNDFPKGERRPKYSPSFGTTLGWEFAERYMADYAFLCGRLNSKDSLEVICALDILEFMMENRTPDNWGDQVPALVLGLTLPLPVRWLAELRSDPLYSDFHGSTVGDYFRYMSSTG